MKKIIAKCSRYLFDEDSIRVFTDAKGKVYFSSYDVANALWYGGPQDFYNCLEDGEHGVVVATSSTDVDHEVLTLLGVAHIVLNKAWPRVNLSPAAKNALAFWDFAETIHFKERAKKVAA